MSFGETRNFKSERHGVAAQRSKFLVQVSGLRTSGDQTATQIAVTTLQHLEQADVLQAFTMQLLAMIAGVHHRLNLESRALFVHRFPGQRAANYATGDSYHDTAPGEPYIAEGQGGRNQRGSNQGNPRVAPEGETLGATNNRGGTHVAYASPAPTQNRFPTAAWRQCLLQMAARVFDRPVPTGIPQ